MTVQDVPRVLYQDVYPYSVVDSLDDLQGPTSGEVELPLHLCWSPVPVFDLNRRGSAMIMYQEIIGHASAEDIAQWVNRDVLKQVWADMTLPRVCREKWETRFPELARLREK